MPTEIKKLDWLNIKAQHSKERATHSVCVTVQENDCRLTDGVISLSPSLMSLTLENLMVIKMWGRKRERIRMNMHLISKDKFL